MLTHNSQCFGNICRTLQFYGLCENRFAFTTDLCYCNDFSGEGDKTFCEIIPHMTPSCPLLAFLFVLFLFFQSANLFQCIIILCPILLLENSNVSMYAPCINEFKSISIGVLFKFSIQTVFPDKS